MIQANELRLNNLVSEEVLGYVTICGVQERTCWIKVKGISNGEPVTQEYHVNNVNLQPIHLSPDILERCGFECLDYNEWYKFYYFELFRIGLHRELNSVFVQYDNMTIDFYTNNFYLHQLQNLIHALTGQELVYIP